MVEVPGIHRPRFLLRLRTIQLTCSRGQPAPKHTRFTIKKLRQSREKIFADRNFLSTPILVFKERQENSQMYHALRWSLIVTYICVQIIMSILFRPATSCVGSVM